MSKFTKTAAAVLALGSSAVFAGTMGPVCTPGSVTVPCERTAWNVGVQALYLDTARDADWGYVGDHGSNPTHLTDSDADWGWGFKLEGSYHFGTGNDLDVNWYHYSKESTNIDINGLNSERFSVDPSWDAVNVEFGQHVDFGEMKDIRFHAGVQYVQIEHDLERFASAAASSPSNSWEARMNAFGPRVGADMTYNFGNGFAVYGNGAAAVLAGTSKFTNYTWSQSVRTENLAGSKHSVVPELEAKLGAKYTMAMGSGDMSLDLGYMWVNYFNAQHLATTNVPSSHAFTDAYETDVAFHGPYVGVKYVGNM